MQCIRSSSFIRAPNLLKLKHVWRWRTTTPTRMASIVILMPVTASMSIRGAYSYADSAGTVPQQPAVLAIKVERADDSLSRLLLHKIFDFALWLERWVANIIALFLRSGFLFLNTSPAIASIPLLALGEKGIATWWDILRGCIRRSGPCTTKFAQWLATRPDLFPLFICENLQSLQSNAYVHSREQSEKALTKAFGSDWRDVIQIIAIDNHISGTLVDQHVMLGSGCVAQVLEGRIGNKPVAIKIVHPGVRDSIEADIKLLRFLSWLIESIVPGARDSFALTDCTEEFAGLMTSQLDLNIEADNLDKFRANFTNPRQWRKPRVTFPQPVRPYVSRDVLVETFEEGRLISDLLQEDAIATLADVAASTRIESANRVIHDSQQHRHQLLHGGSSGAVVDTSDDSDAAHRREDTALHRALRKELATEVLNTLLKMVFEDNFVHADLHPGNILFREHAKNLTTSMTEDYDQQKRSSVLGRSSRLTTSKQWEMSLIDAGLVASLGPLDRQNFIDLFSAVVKNDGARVGRLIVQRSRDGGVNCTDPEAFAQAIGKLVSEVHGSGLALGRVGVGALLQQVLLLCYRYRVKLEPRFASVVLAVGVLEGLGRRLDPDVDILKIAAPYVLKASL